MVFYREDEAEAEKFRPYAMPDAAWLRTLGERLTGAPAPLDAACARGARPMNFTG